MNRRKFLAGVIATSLAALAKPAGIVNCVDDANLNLSGRYPLKRRPGFARFKIDQPVQPILLWRPCASYQLGDIVMFPDGRIVRCTMAGISGRAAPLDIREQAVCSVIWENLPWKDLPIPLTVSAHRPKGWIRRIRSEHAIV